MRRKLPLIGAMFAATIAGLATPLALNTWSLATGAGWFLPAESSLFTFQETWPNAGSGEWWIAGEDGDNFYALDPEEPIYFVQSREVAAHCAGFDRFDTATWCAPTRVAVP